MKTSHLILLTLMASFASTSAKTIYCPTCSQDDFETAYYRQSSPGDTIVLPAGTGTWGNSSRANNGTIYLITNVTVQGQGDTTIIQMDDTGKTYGQGGVIALWAPVTFKDMKIIGASVGHPVVVFDMEAYYNPATSIQMTGGFRLTNITYQGHSDGYFANIGAWVDSGVIDNCRISCDVNYAELIFMRGRTDAWQMPNSLGQAGNVFVEDCTFSNAGYVCDANSNARMVVRFNTLAGTNKVDGHGMASNSPPRSFRNMEVYGNTWTATGAGNWSNIEIRGGTCMVFNNSSAVGWFFLHEYAYDAEPHGWPNFGVGGTTTAENPTLVTTSLPHGYKSGWPVWVQAPLGVIYGMYNITVTGPSTFTIPLQTTVNETIDFATTYKTPYDYPIKDQVGSGMDGRAREPAYVFGNKQNGVAWPRSFGTVCADAIKFYQAQTGNPNARFAESDVIQSNRDFFADKGFDTNTGVSVGTTTQMNSMTPSVVGYGFWVTDQGKWNNRTSGPDGQFYVWNGTTWVFKYIPYTYPHPLRQPSAPAGLNVK